MDKAPDEPWTIGPHGIPIFTGEDESETASAPSAPDLTASDGQARLPANVAESVANDRNLNHFRGRRAVPPLACALLFLLALGAPDPALRDRHALAAPIIAYNGDQPPSASPFPLNDRYGAVAVRLQNGSKSRRVMLQGRIHHLRAYYVREWLVGCRAAGPGRL